MALCTTCNVTRIGIARVVPMTARKTGAARIANPIPVTTKARSGQFSQRGQIAMASAALHTGTWTEKDVKRYLDKKFGG